MIGAIAGDVIGSVYEWRGTKRTDFPLFDPQCRFTDDSVLTVAVAEAILRGEPYLEAVRRFGRRYTDAGYGSNFYRWLMGDEPRPYGSFGNGSATRVSPVGFAFDDEREVLRQAQLSAEFSHNHPEGVKWAQATALAVFLARTGRAEREQAGPPGSPARAAVEARQREAIRNRIGGEFGYDLRRTCARIRPGYRFDVSCQGSVPEAIIAFLAATSYEDTVRLAVSLGGDADTQACIAGGIAEAFYGSVSDDIRRHVEGLLTPDLLAVTREFAARFAPAG